MPAIINRRHKKHSVKTAKEEVEFWSSIYPGYAAAAENVRRMLRYRTNRRSVVEYPMPVTPVRTSNPS